MAVASTSMRLAAPLPADDLRADQPAGALLGGHLHADRLRPREVAGARGGVDERGDEAEAGVARLLLREPGAGHLQVADLGDGGADDAGEDGVAAAEVDARHPALLVGVRAEGDDDPLPGQPVHRLDAVARRPDVGHQRAHLLVDRDAAGEPERDAGLLGQRHVRAHAEAEHHQVGRQAGAAGGVDGAGPPVGADLDLAHRLAEDEVDAHLPHRVGDVAADVGVEGADRGLRHVDHRDVHAAHLARLGDLQPDVAATRRRPRPPPAAVELGPQRHPVVEHLHAVHALGVDARAPAGASARCRSRRPASRTARRTPARSQVAGADHAAVEVDADDLGAHPHVDAVGPVLLGGAADQLGLGLDGPADPVGDAAGGVRRGAPALERRRSPGRPARGACAPGSPRSSRPHRHRQPPGAQSLTERSLHGVLSSTDVIALGPEWISAEFFVGLGVVAILAVVFVETGC
jgi:hypothetical protein